MILHPALGILQGLECGMPDPVIHVTQAPDQGFDSTSISDVAKRPGGGNLDLLIPILHGQGQRLYHLLAPHIAKRLSHGRPDLAVWFPVQGFDQSLDRLLISNLAEVSGSDEPDEPILVIKRVNERCDRGCAHLPEDACGSGLDIRVFFPECADEPVYSRTPHHDETCSGAELCVPGLLLKPGDERIDLLLTRPLKRLLILPPRRSLLRGTFFLQDLTAERSPPDIYHLPFPEGGSCFCPHVLILVLQGIEQRIARRFIRNLPESIDCSKAHLFLPLPQHQKERLNRQGPKSTQGTGNSPSDLRCRIAQVFNENRDRFGGADEPYRLRRHNPDDRHRIIQRLFERPEGVAPEDCDGIGRGDPDTVVPIPEDSYERLD